MGKKTKILEITYENKDKNHLTLLGSALTIFSFWIILNNTIRDIDIFVMGVINGFLLIIFIFLDDKFKKSDKYAKPKGKLEKV